MDRIQPVGSPLSRALRRAFCGVFAGAVFGLIIEPLFFWSGPPEGGVRFPFVGPLLGASSLAVTAVVLGGRRLPDWLARLTVGILGGVVVGVLSGAFVFPPLFLALTSASDPVLNSKEFAAAQRAGVIFGMLLGALAGLLVLGCTWLLARGSKGHSGQTP